MQLQLLTAREEKRALRLSARVTRIDFLLERHKDNKERLAPLKRERHRRSLELEILDIRSEELKDAGAEAQARSETGGAELTAA